MKRKGRESNMLKYEEFSKAVSEREVPSSILYPMAAEMRGKTDEEKNEISRKYAKMIMETYPPRKKGNSR